MDRFNELNARLDELGGKIDEVLERLRIQHSMHSSQGAKGEDLKKRHEMIQDAVNQEVADFEESGRHVSALERSVLEWLEHLSFDK